jgi:hypothetical protein
MVLTLLVGENIGRHFTDRIDIALDDPRDVGLGEDGPLTTSAATAFPASVPFVIIPFAAFAPVFAAPAIAVAVPIASAFAAFFPTFTTAFPASISFVVFSGHVQFSL